jgi:predicted DCC family thiol-disulfide oxidoreductase YuxK
MQPAPRAILLYNDECAVCRHIAAWVTTAARGTATLDVRPIGDDPSALARLHPGLDIWDAYAVIHLLMPDGTMKTGGDAVAAVLRRLPPTRWMGPLFDVRIAGVRPGLAIVSIGYTILAESRPLFGCESCGSNNALVRTIARAIRFGRLRYGSTR